MYPLQILESILDTIPYKKSKNMSPKQSHVAIIYKRGKILSSGTNRLGSRSRGCGWDDLSIHAEIMAIKNIGDISKLRGANLLIVRFNNSDQLMNSKPCDKCQCILEKCMKQYGLLNVYYS
jgi:tRNA(Arg) A34 adenosine deaminase TadA